MKRCPHTPLARTWPARGSSNSPSVRNRKNRNDGPLRCRSPLALNRGMGWLNAARFDVRLLVSLGEPSGAASPTEGSSPRAEDDDHPVRATDRARRDRHCSSSTSRPSGPPPCSLSAITAPPSRRPWGHPLCDARRGGVFEQSAG